MITEPAREGLKRAMLRLRDVQINNREIPLWKNESRQVRRAKERAEEKEFISNMKAQLRNDPKGAKKLRRRAAENY